LFVFFIFYILKKNMSSVFDDLDAEKQNAMDRWVFDRLPLSPEQKAELLRSLSVNEGDGTLEDNTGRVLDVAGRLAARLRSAGR
jgi:hypothetical protein